VIVCWVEDLHSFYLDAFKLEFQVLILIEPQPSRLYRVKVYQPPSITLLGPLQDEMMLSKQVLGTAVRMTVLNALRHNSFFGEPPNHRAGVVQQAIQDTPKPNDLSQYFQFQITAS